MGVGIHRQKRSLLLSKTQARLNDSLLFWVRNQGGWTNNLNEQGPSFTVGVAKADGSATITEAYSADGHQQLQDFLATIDQSPIVISELPMGSVFGSASESYPIFQSPNANVIWHDPCAFMPIQENVSGCVPFVVNSPALSVVGCCESISKQPRLRIKHVCPFRKNRR